MRKTLPLLSLLIVFALAGCGVLNPNPGPQPTAAAGTPTLSPEQVQTQLSMMLTQLPTSTGQPDAATPTVPLPTLPVVETATQAVPTDAPEAATETPEPATATDAPAAEATATLAPTAAATTAPQATATQPPSPAFTAPANDPRTRLGAPTSTDPMDNASTWVWPTGSDKYSSATFSGGAMQVTALDELDGWRMANPTGTDFTNLYLEATFNSGTCSGSDHYGIITRVPVIREPDQGYLFTVTCDGRYSLRRWNAKADADGEMRWLVNWTQSSSIATGSNQVNRLGMFTSGSRLILYVNGVLLTEVQDSTYSRGYFGVIVGMDNTKDYTIRVEEMSYWVNPQP